MAAPFKKHRRDHVGMVPLHRGVRPLTEGTGSEQVAKRRTFANHINDVGKRLNQKLRKAGIDVTFDHPKYRKAINNGDHDKTVNVFCANLDADVTNGYFHDTQIDTAVEVLETINENPGQSGTILGAMQVGKTTTGVAMLLAGPIFRLLSDGEVNYYPVLMSTSHKNVTLQTRRSITNFMLYYGDIPIVERETGNRETTGEYHRRADTEITLANYEHNLLKRRMPDLYVDLNKDEGENRVERRVCGKNIANIQEKFEEVEAGGYFFCLITDEPQFGAAKGSVTERIFDSLIERLVDDENYHIFIGLSATPFEFAHLDRLWTVRSTLPKSYHGYNYWNGDLLDPNAECTQPTHYSFTTVETDMGIQDFGWMDLAAYKPRTLAAYKRKMRKWGYEMDHSDYQNMFRNCLNDLFLHLNAEHHGEGICIRLWNNNPYTTEFMDDMDAQFNLSARFNVIMYCDESAGEEISDLVRAAKKDSDKTILIVVTGGARMGVAFPNSINWFIDFAHKAGDLNALLQGLVGRACGHNKDSKIILSSKNAAILDDYTSTFGSHAVHKTSRHSRTVFADGTKPKSRRGRKKNILRLYECYRHLGDPVMADFMNQMNEMCASHLDNSESNTTKAFIPADNTPRGMNRRVLPIWNIFNSLGVDFYEYLNRPEIKAVALPEIADNEELDFVKPGQAYTHHKRKGPSVTKRYQRRKGFAGISFSDFSDWAIKSGITNLRDLEDPEAIRYMACNISTTTDRTQDGDNQDKDLFFMLNMVRVEAGTTRIMARGEQGAFEWRFFMVTMQLHNSYKPVINHSGTDAKTLPHARTWSHRWTTENEQGLVA